MDPFRDKVFESLKSTTGEFLIFLGIITVATVILSGYGYIAERDAANFHVIIIIVFFIYMLVKFRSYTLEKMRYFYKRIKCETTWNKITDNYDNLMSIMPTIDSGYIIAGYQNIQPHYYGRLIKIDKDGNIQWNKTYDTIRYVWPVVQTSDEGYMVGGNEGKLIRVDKYGNELWNKQVSSCITDIKKITINDYIIAGCKKHNEGNLFIPYGWVAVISDTGDIQWEKEYASESSVIDSIIKVLGGFIFGGWINLGTIYQQDLRGWFVKINSVGEIQYEKKFPKPFQQFKQIKRTFDGGLILLDPNYIIKTDINGNEFWKIMRNADTIEEIPNNGYIYARGNKIEAIDYDGNIRSNLLTYNTGFHYSTRKDDSYIFVGSGGRYIKLKINILMLMVFKIQGTKS